MTSTRFTLRDDAVSWAPTNSGEIVVLDLRTSRYLSLNSSGSTLWQVLDDGATTDEMADALVERFGISREQAAIDVGGFLETLRSRDLVDERDLT